MLRTGDDGLEEWNQGGMSEMDEFHMGSEMDEFHIGFGITLYLSLDRERRHPLWRPEHWSTDRPPAQPCMWLV